MEKESRENQIKENMQLAKSISDSFGKRARKCGIQIEDLRQEGYLSLIRAVDSFPAGCPLSLPQYIYRRVKDHIFDQVVRCERDNSRAAMCCELALAQGA